MKSPSATWKKINESKNVIDWTRAPVFFSFEYRHSTLISMNHFTKATHDKKFNYAFLLTAYAGYYWSPMPDFNSIWDWNLFEKRKLDLRFVGENVVERWIKKQKKNFCQNKPKRTDEIKVDKVISQNKCNTLLSSTHHTKQFTSSRLQKKTK